MPTLTSWINTLSAEQISIELAKAIAENSMKN